MGTLERDFKMTVCKTCFHYNACLSVDAEDHMFYVVKEDDCSNYLNALEFRHQNGMDEMNFRCQRAFEHLGKVHFALCHNKKFDDAEKLHEIMRQLIIFSQVFNKEDDK